MAPGARRTWLIAALAAWLVGGPTGPVEAAGDAAESAPGATVHRVVIKRFAFEPQRLQLRSGDIVEWVNLDIAPHTASADDGAWDSGELARGAVYRQQITAPGTTAYFCAYHPKMRGEIVVAAP